MNGLQSKDLKYIWHPCSQMKDYEEFPSVIIKNGKELIFMIQKVRGI